MADEKPIIPVENKPEPTLIEQEGAVPETVVPVEPPEPEPEAAAAEPVTPAAEPAPKEPTKKPWFIKQIDDLKRAKAETERLAQEAQAKLKVYEAQQPQDGNRSPLEAGLTRSDWDNQVKAEAAKMVQAQAWQSKAQNWIEAGNKEFGAAEFNEKCDMVAAFGASERPEFRQLIVDPDIVPDGHKVVARLADNPEEAQRILSIPDPLKMAAALTKFAMTTPKPDKPISNAPAPIKPIGGSAKSVTLSENDDIKTWMAKRNATARMTPGGKPVH